jgi:hypothetical protein
MSFLFIALIIDQLIDLYSTMIVYFLWHYRRFAPDSKRIGLDVRTINMQSRTAQRNAKYSVLILTTLYLPLMQDIIAIYACDLAFVKATDTCFKGTHLMEAILSAIAIAFYILPIPWLFCKIIAKYKPRVVRSSPLSLLIHIIQ